MSIPAAFALSLYKDTASMAPLNAATEDQSDESEDAQAESTSETEASSSEDQKSE